MPRKEYTEYDIVMAICIQTMQAWGFQTPKRQEWTGWAAYHQVCSVCLSPPNMPCLNMADVKLNRPEPRENKNPHDPRVDWNRMLSGFKNRGYYKPAIEAQVRNWVQHNQPPVEDHMTTTDPMPDWAR